MNDVADDGVPQILSPLERQQWLLAQARSVGRVVATAAADTLGVAVETIRRDIATLEGSGLIRRYHGGAVPIERAGFEIPVTQRTQANRETKHRLALAAVRQLANAESLFLDEGSTTAAVAEALQPDRPLTVVTNSLVAAVTLAAKPMVSVVQLGGSVRPATLGTVAHWAVDMLGDFVLDVAVMGTTRLSAARGMTCGDPQVAAVKRAGIAACRRTILLVDHTKIGHDSTVRFGSLREGDVLVVDRATPRSALAKFRQEKVEIVYA